MSAAIGILIRQERLKQNLSQEGLCKGICVVSYLSKIEQGKAAADPQIIHALFKALGLNYHDEEAMVQHGKVLLHSYFEQALLEDASPSLITELKEQRECYLYSPLYLTYQLFTIYEGYDGQFPVKEMAQLEGLLEQMEEKQQFLYHLFFHCHSDSAVAIGHLQKCASIIQCSIPYIHIGRRYFLDGQYALAMPLFQKSFALASEECVMPIAADCMFMLGNCYANLGIENMMITCYEKAARAFHYLKDEAAQKAVLYNLGASYQCWQQPEKAIHYLLDSLDSRLGEKHQFMVYHKLALAYQELGQLEASQGAFLQMGRYLPDIKQDGVQLLYDVVQHRLQEDYLQHPEYKAALEHICLESHDFIFHGIMQHHARYLMEIYVKERRYKEAFLLMKCWNQHVFPEML